MRQAKKFIVIFGIVIGLMIAVWVIQILTGSKPIVDQHTRDLAEWFSSSLFYDPFHWVTNLGSDFFLVPFVVTAAILLLFIYKDWLAPLIFAGGTLFSHGVNLFIKYLMTRERPTISVEANAEGYSFPSGHAMISMVCYGLLAYFLVKKLKSKFLQYVVQIGMSCLIFLIGISRFVINVHYLTDIIAGFVIGYLLLISLIYLYGWIIRRRKRPNLI